MERPTRVTVDGKSHPILSWEEFLNVLEKYGYDTLNYSPWQTFIGDELIGDGWVVRAHQPGRKRIFYILDIEGEDY